MRFWPFSSRRFKIGTAVSDRLRPLESCPCGCVSLTAEDSLGMSECALRDLHPPVLSNRLHHQPSTLLPPRLAVPVDRCTRNLRSPSFRRSLARLPVARRRPLVRRSLRRRRRERSRSRFRRSPTSRDFTLPRLDPRPHRVLVLIPPTADVVVPRDSLVVGVAPGHRRASTDGVILLHDVPRERRERRGRFRALPRDIPRAFLLGRHLGSEVQRGGGGRGRRPGDPEPRTLAVAREASRRVSASPRRLWRFSRGFWFQQKGVCSRGYALRVGQRVPRVRDVNVVGWGRSARAH